MGQIVSRVLTLLLAWVVIPAVSAATVHANAALPERLAGHGGPIRSITVGPDGKDVLTTSFDYSAILWSLSGGDGTVLKRLFGHDTAVNDAIFLADGGAATVSDDGVLILWDLDAGTVRHRIPGTGDKIIDIAVSPAGDVLALASWDHTIRLHDAETGALTATLKGHRGSVNAVRFSADGRSLFTASYDGTLREWDVQTGALRRRLVDHGWSINVLERLPDGKLAYGLLDGTGFVLDPVSGEKAATLAKHDGPVLGLTVSESGKLIATGGGDGRIRVSDAVTGKVLEEFENPFGPVWALAFAKGDRALFYAGLDDFVSVWTIEPRKPFETVDSVFPRRFQASADMDPGEREFARKCSICHTLEKDGKFRAGPTLFGLFGRRVGTVPGYPYSEALKSADFVWNEETIDKLFDLGPHEYTPGSKMPLQRIRDPERRSALIAYLKRVTDPSRAGSRPSAAATREDGKDNAANPEGQETPQ
ncbi:MAG: c-type cytochrome [Pseudomonadota bacterium]